MTISTVLVIALLVALNGLYVAAEFSSVSVRRSRLEQLAAEGHALAARLLTVLENPHRLDRYIAGCQVGITVSSLGLGAFGQARIATSLTPVFAEWGALQTVGAQTAATGIVLVGLTTLQMVIGELIPKSLALQHPTRVALLTFVPTQLSERLLAWPIDLLNGSGWAVLRLLGFEPTGHKHVHSPEEIRYLIAESTEGGLLAAEERLRMDRALTLAQRSARDLMVPRTRIQSIERAAPLAAAIERAATLPYTRLPVVGDSLDEIVGFVHAKELARVRLSGAIDGPLDSLVRPILFVHEQVSADRVLALMRKERGVVAIVVDDFGGTAGLISVEDILVEVLGAVGDEFKAGEGAPERRADGTVRLPGELRLYAAPRWVGVRWDGESDTVGGLVTERLGRMARVGDLVEIEGVRVEVERVDGNAVRSVIATPRGAGQTDSGDGPGAP